MKRIVLLSLLLAVSGTMVQAQCANQVATANKTVKIVLTAEEAQKILQDAAEMGRVGVAQALLAAGVDANTPGDCYFCKDGSVLTSAIYAARYCCNDNERVPFIKAFIDAGADVNFLSKHDGTTPLKLAIQFGVDDVVELLLNAGSTLQYCSECDEKQLCKNDFCSSLRAAQHSLLHEQEVLQSLERSLEFTVNNEHPSEDVKKRLIQDYNEKIAKSVSAIPGHKRTVALLEQFYKKNGKPKAVNFLRCQIADLKKTMIAKSDSQPTKNIELILTDEQATALLLAVVEERMDINVVFRLLNAGAKPASEVLAAFIWQLTLDDSSHEERIQSVQAMLDAGADVNWLSKDLTGPLHNAAARGLYDVCELLLQAGAKFTKIINGNNPYEVAKFALRTFSDAMDHVPEYERTLALLKPLHEKYQAEQAGK